MGIDAEQKNPTKDNPLYSMDIETLFVQSDSLFLSKSQKVYIYAMGMDKKLQCLVGLTW